MLLELLGINVLERCNIYTAINCNDIFNFALMPWRMPERTSRNQTHAINFNGSL